MKRLNGMIALCIASIGFTSLAIAGQPDPPEPQWEITVGFVMGPVNDVEVSDYYIGFLDEGGTSFSNGFETRPVGASLEDDPTTYNPLEDGESTLTNCLGKRENSWMFEHDPPEPFEDGNGNGSYLFFQIKRSDNSAFTPEEVEFSRTSSLPNSPGWDVSGVVSEYNIDLTGSVIVGVQYQENGDQFTIQSGPMNAEPVNEIRGLAVAGVAVPIDEFVPDMDGQEQLDEALMLLNENFAPWTMTAEAALLDEDGNEVVSDDATVTINPTDMCPADFNGDETVGVNDLLAILSAWGDVPDGDSVAADINADGMVNVDDLLLLLASWGECPEAP